jgi:hypothetical protein
MLYKNKNFCRSKIEKFTFQNGDEFVKCNFSRSVPHSAILAGVTGLRFEKCNLVNCDIPTDATKEDCLHIHKSICSHLHQNRLDAGEITECDDNCEHATDSDELFPGFIVYYYKDKVVE